VAGEVASGGLDQLTTPDSLQFVRGVRGNRLLLLRDCLALVGKVWDRAITGGDRRRQESCWWLILAMPRMLQRRGLRGGKGRGRQSGPTDAHCRRFLQGDWEALWREAQACAATTQHMRATGRAAAAQRDSAAPGDAEAAAEAAAAAKQRAWAATVRVVMENLMAGDLSPAMRRLVAHSGLAPGSTAEVAAALRQLHPEADTAAFSEEERDSLRAFICDLTELWGYAPRAAGGSGLGGRGTGSSTGAGAGGSSGSAAADRGGSGAGGAGGRVD
jgi:hypothetical protein